MLYLVFSIILYIYSQHNTIQPMDRSRFVARDEVDF